MAPQPKRIVRYSPAADLDITENHNFTAHHWGADQADRYTKFLIKAAQLAANTKAGKPIKGIKAVKYVFAKWPKAKNGHNIIFTEEAHGIYILRILHLSLIHI